MKTIARHDYKIPVWALVAIVNADSTGLNDEDDACIDTFEEKLYKLKQKYKAHSYVYDIPENIDEAKYFTNYNDVCGYIGDDVLDVSVLFLK